MFCKQTEAKKAIEASGAQADIGDIEKDMNQVSLGKRKNLFSSVQVYSCHFKSVEVLLSLLHCQYKCLRDLFFKDSEGTITSAKNKQYLI